jgi:signal transduction histidine kinase
MTLTLRARVFLTLLPLLVLIAVLGTAGVVLLYRLGGGIGAILHDNYRSVLYMERLGEAVERIDSSFTFALAGRDDLARPQYEREWRAYRKWLGEEANNITEPGEDALVARLTEATRRYDRLGRAFYKLPPRDLRLREQAYFGPGGLYETFKEIKGISHEILELNQRSMEAASRAAQRTATHSLVWFGVGLAAAVVLAGVLALHTVHTTLRPIRAVTQAALGISAGNLNQVVPYLGRDELGQLARAFNSMARHLRDYRQSHSSQLLRAQQTSQATIDSFPDPVVVLDSEGGVEMANPAARRLLGVVPRPKGDGQPAVPWQPPEPLRQPLAEALRGQRDYLPEGFDHAVLLGAGGHERALLPRILTIRDRYGNLLGAAVLLQDVTRLRLLDQVKSNLVATASHELKTPLTSLRLAVHLLLEEAVGPLTPKQTELLLDARENSERLLAVVNNLLDLARLEQGWRQLDVRPVAPGDLLEAAAEEARPRARDKGLELTVEVPPDLPPVAADAARLGNALGNLLDNALTYTDRGGKITLTAEAAGDGVTLSVSDTGVGIPPEHLPHLFEKFFRVPGQSRGGGTGLGLAIVNEIVVAHGGTVSCESRAGAGTTFRITLPVAAGAPALGPVEGHADGTGRTPQ